MVAFERSNSRGGHLSRGRGVRSGERFSSKSTYKGYPVELKIHHYCKKEGHIKPTC